jgi:hypothetical protein
VEAEYERARKAAASGAREGSLERDLEVLCKGSKEQLEGLLAANAENTEQAASEIQKLSSARDTAAERQDALLKAIAGMDHKLDDIGAAIHDGFQQMHASFCRMDLRFADVEQQLRVQSKLIVGMAEQDKDVPMVAVLAFAGDDAEGAEKKQASFATRMFTVVSDPRSLFVTEMRLRFVCEYSLHAVPCGHDGLGFVIEQPSEFVKQHGRKLKAGLMLLKAGTLAGRALGLPLPTLSSVGLPEALADLDIEAISPEMGNAAALAAAQMEQLDEYGTLLQQAAGLEDTMPIKDFTLEKADEFVESMQESAAEKAEEAKAAVEEFAAGGGGGAAAAKPPPTKARMNAFLDENDAKTGRPRRKKLGLVRAMCAETGESAWVAPENVAKWKGAKTHEANKQVLQGCEVAAPAGPASEPAAAAAPQPQQPQMQLLAADDPSATVSGLLKKRSVRGVFKNWKQRYFLLGRDSLSYYTGSDRLAGGGGKAVAKGSIRLSQATAVEAVEGRYKGESNVFTLTHTPLESADITVMYMSADDDADRTRWVTAIEKAIQDR